MVGQQFFEFKDPGRPQVTRSPPRSRSFDRGRDLVALSHRVLDGPHGDLLVGRSARQCLLESAVRRA
jgi:hypothetical protein